MRAYVGSRTTRERNARGEGITVYRFDGESGSLERVQCVGGLVNPSYLALNAAATRLYCVHGDQSDASALGIDAADGTLTLLNTVSTAGRNPVHLALDAGERHLLVTNHLGATIAVLAVEADGRLGALAQLQPVDGPLGPHRVEQQQPKPHFNVFDPSGRWLLVPDKGTDRVFSFAYQAGRLTPGPQPHAIAREGAGPRHLAWHPGGTFAYVVNELDSSVTAYRFDAACGALEPLQIVSTLPATFTGNSRAAAIEGSPDGRTLYASNRGHDSIAVFRIGEDGLLAFDTAVPSGGRTPRAFTLDPSGQWLFALNEDSDTITRFRVDAATGSARQGRRRRAAARSAWCLRAATRRCRRQQPGPIPVRSQQRANCGLSNPPDHYHQLQINSAMTASRFIP